MEQLSLSDEQLRDLTDMIATRVAINTKEVLNFREACLYAGMSASMLYKLACKCEVPCYKPNGKLLYFNRREFDKWLCSNKRNYEQGDE